MAQRLTDQQRGEFGILIENVEIAAVRLHDKLDALENGTPAKDRSDNVADAKQLLGAVLIELRRLDEEIGS